MASDDEGPAEGLNFPCMIAMTVEGPRMAAWGLETVETPEAFGSTLRAMRARCWMTLTAQESVPEPAWRTVVTDDSAEMAKLEAWAALAKATGHPRPLP